MHEGEIKRQHPHRSQQIEKQMAHRRAFGSDIAAHRSQYRSYRCTDIAAEHKRAGQIEVDPSLRTHYKRDGECRRRRLYDHRQKNTYRNEYQHRQIAHRSITLQESEHFGVALQVRDIMTYQIKAHKEESESDQKLADRLIAPALGEQQGYREAYQRQHESRDVDLEAEQSYDPCRKCSAHIGAHDDGHRLGQRHKSRINEAHHHHRARGGALDKGRYSEACQCAREAVAGHGGEDVAQAVTRGFLKPFAHHFHAVKEKPDSSEQPQKVQKTIVHYV